eukprot:scaffold52114_cov32-Tisochrysis_lutea.AAC.2
MPRLAKVADGFIPDGSSVHCVLAVDGKPTTLPPYFSSCAGDKPHNQLGYWGTSGGAILEERGTGAAGRCCGP